jgi:hypothetical protein
MNAFPWHKPTLNSRTAPATKVAGETPAAASSSLITKVVLSHAFGYSLAEKMKVPIKKQISHCFEVNTALAFQIVTRPGFTRADSIVNWVGFVWILYVWNDLKINGRRRFQYLDEVGPLHRRKMRVSPIFPIVILLLHCFSSNMCGHCFPDTKQCLLLDLCRLSLQSLSLRKGLPTFQVCDGKQAGLGEHIRILKPRSCDANGSGRMQEVLEAPQVYNGKAADVCSCAVHLYIMILGW